MKKEGIQTRKRKQKGSSSSGLKTNKTSSKGDALTMSKHKSCKHCKIALLIFQANPYRFHVCYFEAKSSSMNNSSSYRVSLLNHTGPYGIDNGQQGTQTELPSVNELALGHHHNHHVHHNHHHQINNNNNHHMQHNHHQHHQHQQQSHNQTQHALNEYYIATMVNANSSANPRDLDTSHNASNSYSVQTNTMKNNP
jgi:hypothetical protein